MVGIRLFLGLLLIAFACAACSEETPEKSASPWTQFVHVAGQPDPVPVQWVSTPEGKFAHSIKIPNPVPADSGYQKGMTSKEYFDHLCKTEAGEFIFKTVDGVKGFYFMRPPKRPTDLDLMDRYKLEAPEIERFFQLVRPTAADRSVTFIYKETRPYTFIEEPNFSDTPKSKYVRAFGFLNTVTPAPVANVSTLKSRYGLTWRGVKRAHDRELSIAGGELIVIALEGSEVLAVARTFGLTGRTRNTPEGIWWLNAKSCGIPNKPRSAADKGTQIFEFVSRVLRPKIN